MHVCAYESAHAQAQRCQGGANVRPGRCKEKPHLVRSEIYGSLQVPR